MKSPEAQIFAFLGRDREHLMKKRNISLGLGRPKMLGKSARGLERLKLSAARSMR